MTEITGIIHFFLGIFLLLKETVNPSFIYAPFERQLHNCFNIWKFKK